VKSVPVAVVLGCVLGPLGLLYVGVGHAAAALGAGVALGLVSGGALLLPSWLACGIWGGVAAARQGPGRDATEPLAFRPSLAVRSPVTVKLPPLGSASESSGKFCFQCGAYLPVSARFCNRCGASADAP
jgi:hypothetical protein